MLVWCDLHVARNVLCTAISHAVVYKHARSSKALGTSYKIHVCTALASAKFKSSCTVHTYNRSLKGKIFVDCGLLNELVAGS